MGLKDTLNDMLNTMEQGDFKGSQSRGQNKNKTAIILNNQVPKERKFNFTEEQETIIEDNSDSLAVRAFSGTGKTTVLEGYAKRRTAMKGLYIAFNRSIKEEASKKFPRNVKCVTSHGLAYSKFGGQLKHKLMGYTDWREIYNSTGVNRPFGDHDLFNRMYAILLQETINNFVNTADETIMKSHFISEAYYFIKKNQSLSMDLPTEEKMIDDAMMLWGAMINPNNMMIKATHDTYLKQYQLSHPVLNYDYILLDEAQDSNPALLDIFERQQNRKILVGDPYQSIYGFRNAVDAMNQIKTDKTLDLTISFRFGRSIAEFANSVLALRGETKQIIGIKDEDQLYCGSVPSDRKNFAFIARYNSTLLRDAIEFVSISRDPVFFAGGFESLRPNLLLDLYTLKYGGGYIKDPMLSTYNNYNEFVRISKETDDIEWLGRIRLVEEYETRLPMLIDNVRRRETKNESLAGIIYSTAHKSKGLEFDHVSLANDYYSTPMEEGLVPDKLYLKKRDPMNEELHVFYVASTRAKKSLNIPENYRSYFLDFNKMADPDLFDLHLSNNYYKLLTKNPDFIKKLGEERRKSKNYYEQKASKKRENENKNFEDDMFAS